MSIYLEFDELRRTVYHVLEVSASNLALSSNNPVYIINMLLIEHITDFRIDLAQKVMDPLLKKAERLQSVYGIRIFAALIDNVVDGSINPV